MHFGVLVQLRRAVRRVRTPTAARLYALNPRHSDKCTGVGNVAGDVAGEEWFAAGIKQSRCMHPIHFLDFRRNIQKAFPRKIGNKAF